jgi:hypothetical protein
MSNFARRSALAILLATLFVGLAWASWPSDDTTAFALNADGRFPAAIETTVAGRSEVLRFTGTAIRKKLGIAFFRIAAYCDVDASPADVDAMVAADVPKRLILVMVRNIPPSLFRRGFEDGFANNDPNDQFLPEREILLDYLAARPLNEGDYVTLTHLPRGGLECRRNEESVLTITQPGFARVVWNVYMGPRACSVDLRKGLGTELATN